jgi:hypothetical protein
MARCPSTSETAHPRVTASVRHLACSPSWRRRARSRAVDRDRLPDRDRRSHAPVGALAGSTRNSGCPNSTGCPFSTRISVIFPGSSASISFISFIASMMQRTWPFFTTEPTSTKAAGPAPASGRRCRRRARPPRAPSCRCRRAAGQRRPAAAASLGRATPAASAGAGAQAPGATWTMGAGPCPRVMSSRSGPRRQERRVISVVSSSSTMRRSASTSSSEVAGPSSRASVSSPRFLLAMVRRWPRG